MIPRVSSQTRFQHRSRGARDPSVPAVQQMRAVRPPLEVFVPQRLLHSSHVATLLTQRPQCPRLDLTSACQSSDLNDAIPDGRWSPIAGELFPQEPSALQAPTADFCWEKLSRKQSVLRSQHGGLRSVNPFWADGRQPESEPHGRDVPISENLSYRPCVVQGGRPFAPGTAQRTRRPGMSSC